jgi:hypothetical protein
VSHFLFACDLFSTLSRGLDHISNANPACSCVYICKFQFRPIHPPSRRLSEPQEHASGNPEDTLLGIELHAFRLETSECHFKVGKEVGGFPRLDYDVIDVSLDRSANVLSEHMVHAPLVRRTRIPQTKRHGDIAVHVEGYDERSHELVGLFHPNLVIP